MQRVVVLLLSIYVALVLSTVPANTEDMVTGTITGVWVSNNLYYTFDDQGIMKVIHIDSKPIYYETYYYEIIPTRNHTFIRYGKDLTGSTSINLLFVSDITDSTAVFAYGKPFVSVGSVKGLRGSWKCVEDFTSIHWNIDWNTVDYRQDVLDLKTGEFKTIEEHHGTYSRGKRKNEAGRFYIDFQDGKKVVVIPILYEDIMYIFDLNPGRSLFRLTESVPTYREYQKALKNI